MALVRTTLSAAAAITDKSIVVASATSIATGRLVRVDNEIMQVSKEWVSGTTIPVLRGQDGTEQAAHVITAGVVHGLGSDFDAPAAQVSTGYPAQRATLVQSMTTTGSLVLPPAGTDLRLILNGTSVVAVTVPVPTLDMDGDALTIVSNGLAAHTVTFTGGLGGVGATADIVTFKTDQKQAFTVYAANLTWQLDGVVGGAATVAGAGLA